MGVSFGNYKTRAIRGCIIGETAKNGESGGCIIGETEKHGLSEGCIIGETVKPGQVDGVLSGKLLIAYMDVFVLSN